MTIGLAAQARRLGYENNCEIRENHEIVPKWPKNGLEFGKCKFCKKFAKFAILLI